MDESLDHHNHDSSEDGIVPDAHSRNKRSEPSEDITAPHLHEKDMPPEPPALEVEAPEPSEGMDEDTSLNFLAAGVRDQDELERDIGRQADQMLTEQADERDNKRIEKTQLDKQRCMSQLSRLEQRLSVPGGSSIKNKVRDDIANIKQRISELDTELEQIQERIEGRHAHDADAVGEGDDSQNNRLPNESRRDFLIRTGKITPFSKMTQSLPRTSSNLADVMLDAEDEDEGQEEEQERMMEAAAVPMSHRNLLKPGFADDVSSETGAESDFSSERPAKRKRTKGPERERRVSELQVGAEDGESDGGSPGAAFIPEEEEQSASGGSGEAGASDDFCMDTTPPRKRKSRSRKAVEAAKDDEQEDLAGVDDGNEQVYQARLQSWVKRRSAARTKARAKARPEIEIPEEDMDVDIEENEQEEWRRPHPSRPDTEFEGGLKIPGDIYPSLFDYQKTGVQWLWELYSQEAGGIIGDEMGLGKTIQIIAFLAALHYSNKLDKPIIIVTPATVMKQWVNEFHQWWPPLRVSILHSSGSGMMDVKRERQLEDDLESQVWSGARRKLTKSERAAKKILDRVQQNGHVLITTYSGLQIYAPLLIPTEWGYAVLDEGHKIRNPNAAITVYCKELRTANRVILSGTPMQNNLRELWSLFDFVFPMRLGTLVNFRSQFEMPIKTGGYANASNLQVQTAMQCAETLKETISPYLLQRFKVDVAADLPKKSERVLFCRLTKLQRHAYEFFLSSEEMKSIMAGKRQALYGVDIVRKICNHPDLVEHKTLSHKAEYDYGNPAKSGKMQVVKALLEIWKKNGHKTLVFAQHRIMLDILEKFLRKLDGFNYRRMDGNTAIKDRQDMVDEFNRNPEVDVFLLTTKVGGLGVNLTGADRVIIYDPDWNPSTDVQARERAWRLGQKREVEIYRLMTAGTIEEKIYHRQIFKQFLTNKILRDPKQRQTFQLSDLHDLFTLGDATEGQTETSNIFKGSEVKFSDTGIEKGQRHAPEQPNGAAPRNDSTTNHTATDLNALTSIRGISRQEDWAAPADDVPSKPRPDPSTTHTTSAPPPQKDDRLLSAIFSRTDLHSALEHDAILSSNHPHASRGSKARVTADPQIIAREARRVAAEAARELQRAGEAARNVPAGTPTWTGVVGSAGRPESPAPRPSVGAGGRGRGGMGRGAGRGGGGGGGPSSASVLANLAARQGTTTTAAVRNGTPDRGGGQGRTEEEQQAPQPKGRAFLAMIRDYLRAQGGAAYTQMLIDHFNRFCGSPQRTAEFKEMLRRIAVLDKGPRGRGRGRWVLKEEFGGRG